MCMVGRRGACKVGGWGGGKLMVWGGGTVCACVQADGCQLWQDTRVCLYGAGFEQLILEP